MKNKRKWYPVVLIVLLLVLFYLRKPEKENSSGTDYRNTSNLIYTRHAKCRMECRHIDAGEVKEVIEDGQLNESKSGPGKNNDETYALEGWSTDNQHIRVVVTPESDGLLVITVIDLGKDWPCDCD